MTPPPQPSPLAVFGGGLRLARPPDGSGATRVVLDGVDLHVGWGEIVVIVGGNGAGKSTLLRALVDLEPTVGGAALVDGAPPADPRSRRRLGYVPERARWPRGLAIGDAVQWLSQLSDAAVAVDWAAWGLGADDPTDDLSGGQAQIAAFLQAAALRPQIWLLDEPLAGIDPHHAAKIVATIRAARDGGAAIVVTAHDSAPWGSVCDRVLHLQAGRLDGPAAPKTDVPPPVDGAHRAPPGAISTGVRRAVRGFVDLAPTAAGALLAGQITATLAARSVVLGGAARATLDVALAAAWLGAVAASAWLGAHAWRDLDDRTAIYERTRPWTARAWAGSRVLGAGIAASAASFGACAIAGLIGAAFGASLPAPGGALAFAALTAAEGALVAQVAAAWATRLSPSGGLAATLALWVGGHLAAEYRALPPADRGLPGWLLFSAVPDLDRLDVQALVVHGGVPGAGATVAALGYAAAWAAAWGALAALSAARREIR